MVRNGHPLGLYRFSTGAGDGGTMPTSTTTDVTVATTSGPADLRDLDWLEGDEAHRRLAGAMARHDWAHASTGPIVLRYDGVGTVLASRDLDELGVGLLKLSGVTGGVLYEWWTRIMFANEGERHRELRDVARSWLTPRRVEALAQPVRDATRATLDSLPQGERVDLAAAIASPIPAAAICMLLGVDTGEVEQLGEATTDVGLAFGLFDEDEHRRIVAALEVLLEWGDRALRSSEQGTLARAIRDAAAAGDVVWDDAVALIANLLFAGQDTTRFLIANALWLLGRYPDVWEQLVRGKLTAANVVEETLRFQPPASGVIRVATAPVTIGTLRLDAGDVVEASLWSAGRDPAVYEDPQTFRPGLDRAPTLSFGRGRHYCLGAALARLDATVVLDEIAHRCPRLEIDWEQVRWRGGTAAITGVEELPAVLV